MKVYIAGPMTGVKDFNFPAFFDAEETLINLGHEVYNPAHNDGPTIELALKAAGTPENPNHTWTYYMRRDLPLVLKADAICLLPGWQDSNGASLEVTVAKALGIPLMILKNKNLVPRIEVLGLSGYARSGKDTVGDVLVKNGYTKFSFASELKQAIYNLNPLVSVDGMTYQRSLIGFDLDKAKVLYPEIRKLLQRMGTEVGRELFGEDFWVESALSKIPDGTKAVFTDCRFPNEADAIRNLGGNIWRIKRDAVGPINGHVSETSLDNYDFDQYIINNSTIENLTNKVQDLLNDQGRR